MSVTIHDFPAIPQFPGSDPMADPDPAAFALAASYWLTPSALEACGRIDPEFTPVSAAARARMIGAGLDAITEAFRS